METYLLLRSNKQSGPYSLQQLVNLGLKPYDLVWVEGKSAAWRYPSEVDLLKDYAPATEEQPYDRFYKKPEEKPAVKPVPKQEEIYVAPTQEESYVAPMQEEIYVAPRQEESYVAPRQEETYVAPREVNHVLPVENKTVTTNKKVFVLMPHSHVAKKPAQPIQVTAAKVVEQKPATLEEREVESKPILIKEEPVVNEKPVWPKAEPVKNEKIISVKEEPILNEKPVVLKEEPTLNEKYSESLEDIKRRYTETYLSRKKKTRWTSTHTSLAQVFGGAIFFCMLVVFAYKNFSGEEQSQSRTTLIQPDKRAVNTATTTTPTTIPAVTTETNKQQTEKRRQTIREKLNPPDESLAVNTKQQKNEEIITGSEVVASEYEPEKKAVMTKSTDEIKTEPVKPKTRPVNFNRLVNVKANNYKQRAFGGVMNLELTVNNDSKYDLDKVIVELQYLKPSEQPIKTERIVFNSVEANGSQTLKIPDYLRGVKVAYRVTGVESSQYERQTAGL